MNDQMKRLLLLPLFLALPIHALAAFPQVVESGTSEVTANQQNQPVTIGSPAPGVLVVVQVCVDGSDAVTTPVGWTELFNDVDALGATYVAAYRVADGTEGATITFTTAANQRSVHRYYQIDGFDGVPEASVLETTGSNPPSLAPTGGAKDYLWLASVCKDNNPGPKTITGFPTNYTGTGSIISADANNGMALGFAQRELNAASEDPGAFTVDSDTGHTATIAVHPDAAASPLLLRRHRADDDAGPRQL